MINQTKLVENVLRKMHVLLARKLRRHIEQLPDTFINTTIQSTAWKGVYPNFEKVFASNLQRLIGKRHRDLKIIVNSFGERLVIRTSIRLFSSYELDRMMPMAIKRKWGTGSKYRPEKLKPMKIRGYWRFFEYGVNDGRNWGSKIYVFIPAKNGGGFMAPISKMTNSPAFKRGNKTHPGVKKLGMLEKGRKEFIRNIQMHLNKILKEGIAEITQAEINTIVQEEVRILITRINNLRGGKNA